MWWEGGCDVIFNITEGGFRTNFFCFGGGVLSKFLLYNSSFSAPPLLIIIAQSLSLGKEICSLLGRCSWGGMKYELP